MDSNATDKQMAQNEIDKVIGLMDLAEDQKKLIKKAFHALKDDEVARMEKIVRRAEAELRETDNKEQLNDKIYTILVPRKEQELWQKRNFYPVVSEELSEGTVFLNCAYEEFEGILKQKGICQSLVYFEAEEELFKLADQCNFLQPVIFSPWSRRAITAEKKEKSVLAGLPAGMILENHVLMWNIEIMSAEFMGEAVAPDGDKNIYVSKYAWQKGGVLYIDAERGVVKDRRYDEEEGVAELSSACGLSTREAKLYIIHNPADYLDYINKLPCTSFRNSFKPDMRLPRLRTCADIANVLSVFFYEFDGCKFSCSFELEPENKEKLLIYTEDEKYKYLLNKDEKAYWGRRMRNAQPIKVGFSGDKQFLVDYAAYALSYLQYMYPEFHWEGFA